MPWQNDLLPGWSPVASLGPRFVASNYLAWFVVRKRESLSWPDILSPRVWWVFPWCTQIWHYSPMRRKWLGVKLISPRSAYPERLSGMSLCLTLLRPHPRLQNCQARTASRCWSPLPDGCRLDGNNRILSGIGDWRPNLFHSSRRKYRCRIPPWWHFHILISNESCSPCPPPLFQFLWGTRKYWILNLLSSPWFGLSRPSRFYLGIPHGYKPECMLSAFLLSIMLQ